MKFVQVDDGQQFEYQGKIYTKKGPMMAVDATGASKLIPRSADVTPASGQTMSKPATPDPSRQIAVQQVLAAFDRFYVSCESLARGEDQAVAQKLEEARQTFLQTIDR
ncbi:MAG: hypothetical protein OEZ39_18155 [Gammaproteobacteria bacterium]|nr:hypothetical protein [Gammaproteobacteria bacterium]MDH5653790.1 hypothetical protein [Gammaproteobacteria bacterium]